MKGEWAIKHMRAFLPHSMILTDHPTHDLYLDGVNTIKKRHALDI